MNATLANHIEYVKKKFKDTFSVTPSAFAVAPGRINVIGEHTDYNFGLSLPAAIDRWVIVAFAPNTKKIHHFASESFGNTCQTELSTVTITDESWKKYIKGALELFSSFQPITHGINAYIWGNVPLGSGVSSSAAFEVALMNMLRYSFNASNMSDLELVKTCQQIEHQYVGVKSGLLDQYASQFSKAGKLMILDFQSLTHHYFDADTGDWCWVLANTKVKRELSGSKYSERVAETRAAFEDIQLKYKEVKHFRDIKLIHLDAVANETHRKRIQHYVEENERVFKTAEAFSKKDVFTVGKLLNATHQSLKELYEVSCDELDFMADFAQSFNGCAGSRMMGGGFGGCTINLIKKDQIDAFTQTLLPKYKKTFGIEGEILAFNSVNGAEIVSI